MSDCCSSQTTETPKPAAQTNSNCPECGQTGKAVEKRTLKHQVKPEHLDAVERGSFHFCRTPTCEVVYFGGSGVVLRKADVRNRVTQKETEDPVPICYCFGFTERMAREEILATGKCAIPQRITAEVKAGNCACEIRNPQGACCLGNVNLTVKRTMAALTVERSRK